ncbi:MAG: FAD-binding protein [Betaproteobacteria bacterium]|nr:FAD-binding protein [Betaproteobacteria bacterium]
MPAYPKLFSPITVGNVTFPNRIMMGSMHTGLEPRPGGMERLAEFYAERARGGTPLMVTGGFSPNRAGNLYGHPAEMVSMEDRDRHRPVPKAVHAAGARILLQLLHAGRYGTHKENVAPSPIKSPITPFSPRELTGAEVVQTVTDFADAAVLARDAGYDGVEIMGSEGYLITQFLAPRTNHRKDEWGGSLENRMRLAVETVKAVRAAVGRDFLILYRVSVLDLVEGGLPGEEIVAVAQAVEAAGADFLNSGIGWHEARIPTIAQAVPRGGFAWASRRVKDAVKIPVIASNRINAPEIAEDIIARGDADMVSLARALLADEAFAAKAQAGDRAGINICIACNQACLDHIFTGSTANCLVNPRAGRETQLVFRQAAKKKTVAVVGGGPAGLSCAAVAAERGHAVTLFEKAVELGGQFNLAKKIPGKLEFAESIAYYAERLRRAGVKTMLGHEAGAAELAPFDEVVIATGIDPRKPDIPGIDSKTVVSYTDVIAGRAKVGANVVILGAGGIGFDTALYLLEGGSRSSLDAPAFAGHWGIDMKVKGPGGLDGEGDAHAPSHRITMLKRSTTSFGNTLGKTTGWVHRIELARNRVAMVKGVEYRRIDGAGVHVTVDGKEQVVPADTVILCTGQDPHRGLADALEKAGRKPHLIGGAKLASELDAKRAMLEGAELAAAL